MTSGARKTQQQVVDDIDLDPAELAEIDAAIDEGDAYFAAGNDGIPADIVLAKVRQILRR
jgi:hypothetical protein